MSIELVELRRVELPLVEPFRTSFGEQDRRAVLLVRVVTADGEGWGECAAFADPTYSDEHVDGAALVLADHLVPRLFEAERSGGPLAAADIAGALADVRGHRMAKAAVELAVLDAELRAGGERLADRLGATADRVPCGISIGMAPSSSALVELVERRVAEGYARVKLKVAPGHDVEPVAAVRAAVGADVPLQVDANGAYDVDVRAHLDALDALDELGLQLLEQPLAEEDLLGHARLTARLRTPVCLDETVTSAVTATQAIKVGACRVVNVKAGRVGGYLEAVRVHDACRQAGIPVWCGGMLETGIGRAANVALAALPGFTLPGDVSPSARWFAEDLTEPLEMVSGHIDVPSGPGVGRAPDEARLREMTSAVRELRPRA